MSHGFLLALFLGGEGALHAPGIPALDHLKSIRFTKNKEGDSASGQPLA
jgi:hypothetical protein